MRRKGVAGRCYWYAGGRYKRELDLVHRFPFLVSLGFLFLYGNVYEWSTLKLMLHIIGQQRK